MTPTGAAHAHLTAAIRYDTLNAIAQIVAASDHDDTADHWMCSHGHILADVTAYDTERAAGERWTVPVRKASTEPVDGRAWREWEPF